jgi:hypothetical protein
MNTKIGCVQVDFLRCMVDHGGCTSSGWTWGAHSLHNRVLASLVRRGYAKLVFQGQYSHHEITEDGRQVVGLGKTPSK